MQHTLTSTEILKEALNNIFEFLSLNREFNKELQTRFYSGIIGTQNSITEKLISLLYHTANTQSQPKIDKLAEFYQYLYQNIKQLNTFRNFCLVINDNIIPECNYNNLFNGMKSQNGWGKKTSALFVKSIFQIHNGNYPKELKIWDDAPEIITPNDSLYLPVDSVIISIFSHIKEDNWNFDNINKLLSEHYSPNEIEVWDDLWFWGFITQSGSGKNREFQWNLNKYWILRESDKDETMISKIESKSLEFLKILDQVRCTTPC